MFLVAWDSAQYMDIHPALPDITRERGNWKLSTDRKSLQYELCLQKGTSYSPGENTI
jgi:hypothetical protein